MQRTPSQEGIFAPGGRGGGGFRPGGSLASRGSRQALTLQQTQHHTCDSGAQSFVASCKTFTAGRIAGADVDAHLWTCLQLYVSDSCSHLSGLMA